MDTPSFGEMAAPLKHTPAKNFPLVQLWAAAVDIQFSSVQCTLLFSRFDGSSPSHSVSVFRGRGRGFNPTG